MDVDLIPWPLYKTIFDFQLLSFSEEASCIVINGESSRGRKTESNYHARLKLPTLDITTFFP
jgi:hypothetical protein